MEATIDKPAAGETALLIIDMINDLDFKDAEKLGAAARDAASVILELRDAADRAGVPVVYVNDNFGQWHSERSRLVEHARRKGGDAAEIVGRLAPRESDYFVIKPQVSGFYATNLQVLLPQLRATRLIMTGVAADICVLFTAAGAHMREYELWVPADGVASSTNERKRWALEIMSKAMNAETASSEELSIDDWLARRGGEGRDQ